MEAEKPESVASAQSPKCYRWIPTSELVPGMVLARPVYGGSRIEAIIHLAVGTPITANTIEQIFNKGIECVAVLQDSHLDEAVYAGIVANYESRLLEIFGPDPDEHCRSLLHALLADGPSQC